jgi:hypothetical protein
MSGAQCLNWARWDLMRGEPGNWSPLLSHIESALSFRESKLNENTGAARDDIDAIF